MVLDDLVGAALNVITLTQNKNVLELTFNNGIILEIYAVPMDDDGKLYIDMKKFRLERKITSTVKISE